MPTINDLKKKALNDAGYLGTITQAEKAWLEEICAPYKATIPEMWRYALALAGFTGPLPEAQSRMMSSLGHTGALPNKWYKYWRDTPLVFDPISSIFADGTDGFYFDFSKTDRLFQNLRNTPADDAGENICLALESSKWGGRSFAEYLASRTEEANIGTQSLTVATGSQNAGGWDLTATGNFAGVSQTISGVAGETFVVDFEWSGNNEARQLWATAGGANVNSNSTAASGTARLFVTATGAVTSAIVFLSGSTSGDTIFIKINSIKRVEKNHGLQATASAQPKWQTGGLARFDGIDDCLSTPLQLGNVGSLVVKFNKAAGSDSQVIIGQRPNTTEDVFLLLSSAGRVAGSVGTGSSISDTANRTGLNTVGAITWNGTTVNLYVQGVLVATQAQSGSVVAGSATVILGSALTSSLFASVDLLHALGIKKALTAAEIAAITNYWNS